MRDVDDAIALGIGHSALNLNQPTIMRSSCPAKTRSRIVMDGREFYFDEDYLRKFDAAGQSAVRSQHHCVSDLAEQPRMGQT